MNLQDILLEVKGLKKYFPVKGGIFQRTVAHVHAVDDISFYIRDGETLGLVGESGCGKTTVGRCVLLLIKPTAGEIKYLGQDLCKLSERKLRRFRTETAMIFQDPYSSLNPRMTVADAVGEPLEVHGIAKGLEKERKVKELLVEVGLSPYQVYKYPHEFSGGERQRICIARALAVRPKFIVADEPVAALDVSVRAGILNLMKELQRRFKLTYLFISHDLSVIRHMCDRVMVMYLGKLVEVSEANELFSNPYHPYTEALISSVPIPDPTVHRKRIILPGSVPTPINPPPNCRFSPRCVYATEKCSKMEPSLIEVKNGHFVACHHYI